MSKALTYRDVVQNWKHYIADRSGFESRSNGWSNRALLDQFLIIRSSITRQLILSGFDLGQQMIQTLPCIALEEALKSDCPCAPPSGCVWLKSVHPLPKYLKILSVNTIEGNKTLSFTEWDKVKYKTQYSRSKTKDKSFFYTIRVVDGEPFLYVLNTDFLKLVSVDFIPEDPYCVTTFPKCSDGKPKSLEDIEKICNPWDTPFLMDRAYIQQVFQQAWETLPRVKAAAGPDLYNDSVDNTRGDINLKI